MFTRTEEDYIKAIFKITDKNQGSANTNAIAKELNTSAASVTDMLKKLAEKDIIHYERYKGVYLTSPGKSEATKLLRKHRLWEVFLVDKLKFEWHEVHHIAEQLEHIQSDTLVNRLDAYLGFPKFDPHGDPIPNIDGKFTLRNQVSLDTMAEGEGGIVVGVREHHTPFLEYLNSLEIELGTEIIVQDLIPFEKSKRILINQKSEAVLTHNAAKNIFLKKSLT